MLLDPFNRPITYLRVSVTDRCNFRCVYCMPVEGVAWQKHENILQYEEIARVVDLLAKKGINQVRITGGEPLVRRNLADLIKLIRKIPKITDISLTTNGALLSEQASDLFEAGLHRINISLDTLKPELYEKLTRGGQLHSVLEGIEKAEKLGMQPIKLNTVIMKNVNSDEINALANLTLEHNWHVRFIELMPILNQSSWGEGFPKPSDMYMPINEVKELLQKSGLTPASQHVGQGPAEEFLLKGGKGRIGFISPLSKSFCERCNRLRLTADGNLRPCLLDDHEVPLREALRSGADITPLITKAIQIKPREHDVDLSNFPKARCMMQIGG